MPLLYKKVYAIIVTFNGAKWVDKCLSSLKDTTIPISTIVIDNNSKDGTRNIIKEKYPEVDLIPCNENLGFGKANNLGIKRAYEAGADYFFLLNQDAWVERETIEKLIDAHKKEPDFGVISPIHLNGNGDALDLQFSNYIIPKYCPNLYSDVFVKRIKKSIYEVNFVNAAAWLISRRCIEDVGGFSPAFFHYAEDNNYIHRVRFHGMKVGIHPLTCIYHDRELRENLFLKQDSISNFVREKVLYYSNPFNCNDISLEIKQLKKMSINFLLKLKINSFNIQRRKINLLGKVTPVIRKSKEISIQKGLSFLNNS